MLQKFMNFATPPVVICTFVSVFTRVEASKTLHRGTFCPEELQNEHEKIWFLSPFSWICDIVCNTNGREGMCFVFVTPSRILSFSFSIKIARRHVNVVIQFQWSLLHFCSVSKTEDERNSYAWAVVIKLSHMQLCLQDLLVYLCV
jgi:hypothetical protein